MAGDARYGRLYTASHVRAAEEHMRLGAPDISAALAVLDAGPEAWPPGLSNDLPADEPLFLVRGSDPVAGPVIAAYTLGLLNIDGMTEADERVQRAQAARLAIEEWQREHPDRVKAPD